MIYVYYNGQQVDLMDRKIAITKQFKLIEDLSKIQCSFTNQFTLPWTDRNRKIFKDIDDVGSQSDIPYTLYGFDIVANGQTLMEKGTASVISVDKKGIDIAVYDKNLGFLSAIKGLSIKDINFSNYNLELNWSNIRERLNDPTKDWNDSFPLTFRLMSGCDSDAGTSGTTVYVDQLVPMFQMYFILYRIAVAAGYDILNTWVNSDVAKKISKYCLTLSDLKTSFDKDIRMPLNMRNPFYSTPSVGVSEYKITGWSYSWYNSLAWNASQNYFVAPMAGKYTFCLQGECFVGITGTSLYFYIKTDAGDSDPSITFTENLTNPYQYFKIWHTVTLAQGQKVMAMMVKDDPAGAAYPSDFSYAPRYYGLPSKFTLTAFTPDAVSFGQKIDVSLSLPIISQVDFIKLCCMVTGSVLEVNESTKRISLTPLNDLLENEPIDWSAKYIRTEKIDFKLENWNRLNKFLYTEDKIGNPYNVGDFGVLLDDENLEGEATIYQAPVAGSNVLADDDFVDNDGDIAGLENMPVYVYSGGSFVFTNKLPPRIYSYKTYAKSLTISDRTGNTATKVGYPAAIFGNDTAGEESLDWLSIIKREYGAVIDIDQNDVMVGGMLYKTKRVEAWFLLDEADIMIDPMTPVYVKDLGASFYVNKIVDYIEGQQTKVELIKMTNAIPPAQSLDYITTEEGDAITTESGETILYD